MKFWSTFLLWSVLLILFFLCINFKRYILYGKYNSDLFILAVAITRVNEAFSLNTVCSLRRRAKTGLYRNSPVPNPFRHYLFDVGSHSNDTDYVSGRHSFFWSAIKHPILEGMNGTQSLSDFLVLKFRVGEKVQQLWVLAALSEDLNWIPSTHVWQQPPSVVRSALRVLTPSSGHHGHLYTHTAYTHTDKYTNTEWK